MAIEYLNLHYFKKRFCGNNSLKYVACESLNKRFRTGYVDVHEHI